AVGEGERRRQQQPEPQEARRERPQRLGVRADGEAEEQQRGRAEDERGHGLGACAPLQEELLAQGRNHARIRPASRVICRSQKRSTRSTWCVAKSTVAPCCLRSATTSSTSAKPAGSSWPNGSSSITISGFCSSTRANESRLRMPAE